VTWLQVSCEQPLEQGKYWESGSVDNNGNIRKKWKREKVLLIVIAENLCTNIIRFFSWYILKCDGGHVLKKKETSKTINTSVYFSLITSFSSVCTQNYFYPLINVVEDDLNTNNKKSYK